MKPIIQQINKLGEDIFGHLGGLRRYLEDDKSPCKPLSRPSPPPLFDSRENIVDLSLHTILLKTGKRTPKVW